MKKAKILVALGALVAVAAAAFASKANTQKPFYSLGTDNKCNVTTSLFATTTKAQGAQRTHLSVAPTTAVCPTITLITDL